MLSAWLIDAIYFFTKDVLKTGSGLHQELLIEEVTKVKQKHRTPFYCDQLLKFINENKTN
jgi:hypothetical protein